MSENAHSDAKALDLLNELENILESDPLIDEVGFVHPSQFATLKEVAGCAVSSQDVSDHESTNFWIRDHKLGISTQVLLPLYKAAKHAFMAALREYKTSGNLPGKSGDDTLESEVMTHSKALLMLSCDFGTAWNSRKFIVLKKELMPIFMNELLLSALVLSYAPKSERAWSHSFDLKATTSVTKCMKVVTCLVYISHKAVGYQHNFWKMFNSAMDNRERIRASGKNSRGLNSGDEMRSKMNYRAWNHRCWLVSYMTREQVLHQLEKSRNWASLHVADSSCFHYRRRLMLRIYEDFYHTQADHSSGYNFKIYNIWKEELDWNEALIGRYVGREALWLHRRFLSSYWIRHIATDLHSVSCQFEHESSIDIDVGSFIDHELHLLDSCSTIPDDDFEDFQAQAIHSATYILWLTKQIPKSHRIDLQEKLRARDLKRLLNMACPERSSLWNCLVDLNASKIQPSCERIKS
ncbi:hypothetical protein JRO89_XS04G0153500 [Xanthoceras sorbifolium]|uniref:Protein prenyltransferase alpha subunit repeat-containing protein 1 n=1 Tax=Xanthoceras sorbifolium TaxID=99658 RepID=A0ABQ8I5C2_9ROSI|nr:hypothetical protein JRO89_XS04G0153500 [Xanthoceras sorbifolium]